MTEHPSFAYYLEAWLYLRTHGLLASHRIEKIHFREWRITETETV